MFGNQLKKKYTMGQLYGAFVNGYLSIPKLSKNRRKKIVDQKFIERLMLATTEVNGCEVCSYAHTQMALKEGFTREEISSFLSGSEAFVKEEEAIGILYAQHVADTMGNPDPETYERLEREYGAEKACIMKAAITVMMMGNISGIPLSAFLRRVKGHAYENSTLLYEISMLLVQPAFMVLALPPALLK
ncbi:MAG: carboxymuconolactone decarboxylase family protein, partial [Clostridia bacterium]|nr:carboxymuconolactone decarboxylase family protein [Clostridia bacterium]